MKRNFINNIILTVNLGKIIKQILCLIRKYIIEKKMIEKLMNKLKKVLIVFLIATSMLTIIPPKINAYAAGEEIVLNE